MSSSAKRPRRSDPVEPRKTILSENLRKARERSGLSLEKVGKRVGATRGSVHGWESGAYTPGEDYLERLALLYGTTPSDLRYSDSLPVPAPEPPRVSLGLAPQIRIWIQEFLLDLTKAHVSEREVDEARRVLTNPDFARFFTGGEPTDETESQLLEGLVGYGEAIKSTLRSRGYSIPK